MKGIVKNVFFSIFYKQTAGRNGQEEQEIPEITKSSVGYYHESIVCNL